MSITANAGPLVIFGGTPTGVTPQDYNPERGPSMFDQGYSLLDPRVNYTYEPGQDFGSPTYGFLGTSDFITLNIEIGRAHV